MLCLYRGDDFNPNFYYHAKVDIDHTWYLETDGVGMLLTSIMNKAAAEESFNGEVHTYQTRVELEAFFNGKTLEADLESLSAAAYLKLSKLGTVVDVSDTLEAKRIVKSKKEQQTIRTAARVSQRILEEVNPFDFKTEKDVHSWLLQRTLELGAEPAYDPIVATGTNSRFPHYHARNVPIKDWVLIDYGVRLDHYASDLTRCYAKKERSKEQETYERLEGIFGELVRQLPDFETGAQLAAAQEKIYEREKLPTLIHSIGHGIGLEVHERPRLSKRFTDPLKGTTVALEPATYNESFGARYENTLFVGKKIEVYLG